MYFVLESDPTAAPHVTLDTREDASLDLRWLEGMPIPPQVLPLPLELVAERHHERYPDFFDAGHGPAVSSAFREALASAGIDNVEYLPAVLTEDDQPISDSYAMINVIGRVSCIDVEKSRCTTHGRKIFRMKSMMIDEQRTHGLAMFRPHEYAALIFVSEHVAKALEAARLSGFLLSPAQGWSDANRF